MANITNNASGFDNNANVNSLGSCNKPAVLGHGENLSGGSGTNKNDAESLRDIFNFIQTPMENLSLQANSSPYEYLVETIRGLDMHDDGILMNKKIKSIETSFCELIQDENMLFESMNYINEKALVDSEVAVKFALLFSSRNFDALAMKDIKLRSAMLKILETNFLSADIFRQSDKERLYNSITLLGEYYNRVRLADNAPITILGESLLELLLRELRDRSSVETLDVKMVKCVLSQITLNGDLLRTRHKTELTHLLFHVRRHIIEQPALTSTVRAVLLMTLDVFYNNFKNLGKDLEDLYMKYYTQPESKSGDVSCGQQQPPKSGQNESTTEQQRDAKYAQNDDQIAAIKSPDKAENSYDFDFPPSTTTTKRWSEQVSEDESLSESGDNDLIRASAHKNSKYATENGSSERFEAAQQVSPTQQQHPGRSPNQLRYAAYNNKKSNRDGPQNPHYQKHQPHGQVENNGHGKRKDQAKPLPRWRATRFNRDNEAKENSVDGENYENNRVNSSYDEDCRSVRSEGLRLYSINDRLRHSQEKFERSYPSSNNYFIANSNWDRQSQPDDQSERSYISNYEYGNGGNISHRRRRGNGRGGGYNQSFDKPPRFKKYSKHEMQYENMNAMPKGYEGDWRRHRTHSGNSNSRYSDDLNYKEQNRYNGSTGDQAGNSKNFSHARTLPRQNKSSDFDGISIRSASFRRSNDNISMKSLDFHHADNRSRSREFTKTDGGEAARYNKENLQTDHSKSKELDLNRELVRNARHTAKYMNYLSSQK